MNPYKGLPEKSFWKLSVAQKSMFDIDELWNPKFRIMPKQAVVTYGSCFAQNIGRALLKRGFNWLSTERPHNGLSLENAKLYNYNIFSSRTGNIYTTSLLEQWVEWALGIKEVPEEIWEKGGRYYDPFRPNIEPNGFESALEVLKSREYTIRSFNDSIIKAKYFVFTLGLTESWINSEHGYEYPMCPGTIAGDFDPKTHKFINQKTKKIKASLLNAIKMMRSVNKGLKFLLTVSPVPLTATKSENHVLVATMESKSILRAVTGELVRERNFIDYFPSYEIFNSPVFKGAFFEPNLRSVNAHGVDIAMDTFFSSMVTKFGEYRKVEKKVENINESLDDEVCEEELLEVFGGSNS